VTSSPPCPTSASLVNQLMGVGPSSRSFFVVEYFAQV
jgi:hypothetical protein